MAHLHDPGPNGSNHDNWNQDPHAEDRGDDVVRPWGIR